MISIERKLILVGRMRDSVQGAWAGATYPYGGAGEIGRDAGWVVGNTLDQASYVIQTPARANTSQGPIKAISIANDSPIESAVVHIGQIGAGISSFKIGVGAPFIGDVADDAQVWVTPARTMPILYRTGPAAGDIPTPAEYRAQVIPWECDTADTDASGIVTPKMPLRIDVHRGAFVRPASKRAVYHADMQAEVQAGPTSPRLIVITDGRRRVRVWACQDTGGACSLTVRGIEGFKTTNTMEAPNDSRMDQPTFDELLAATALTANPAAATVFDYTGNPYFAIVAIITGTANDLVHVGVSAWDE